MPPCAGTLEVVISEEVVYVVLGVDDVPDRSPRLGLSAHLDCLAGELRRVHDHHAVRGNHEARVTAPELGRGEYVLGNLFHGLPPWRGRDRAAPAPAARFQSTDGSGRAPSLLRFTLFPC